MHATVVHGTVAHGTVAHGTVAPRRWSSPWFSRCLLLIVFGIIDFGRALNAQITLTQAAREGARLAALGEPNVVAPHPGGRHRAEPGQRDRDRLPARRRADRRTRSSTASYSFSFVTPIGAIAGLFGGGGRLRLPDHAHR